MTRIYALSSDRGMPKRRHSRSPRLASGSWMSRLWFVIVTSWRGRFAWQLLSIDWMSVRDIYFTVCAFRRRPTLSGHRLLWDLAEAISDPMRWSHAKLSYVWPINGLCERMNDYSQKSLYAWILSTCIYLLVLYLAINQLNFTKT